MAHNLQTADIASVAQQLADNRHTVFTGADHAQHGVRIHVFDEVLVIGNARVDDHHCFTCGLDGQCSTYFAAAITLLQGADLLSGNALGFAQLLLRPVHLYVNGCKSCAVKQHTLL